MQVQQIIPFVIITIAVVFYTYLFFQGRIMRHFNLVDRRQFVGSEQTYQRLNTLMDKGDVSLYSHEFMSDVRITLSVTYAFQSGESVSNRFSTKSLDEAVNQAYAWSVEKGLIKE